MIQADRSVDHLRGRPAVGGEGGVGAGPARPMRLAVLLLCHEPAEQLVQRLALHFFAEPDIKVYVHYDARRSDAELQALKALLPAGVQCRFVEDRVACRWGDYSLVEATHRMLRLALADDEFAFDYTVLLSGSCIPLRPWSSLRQFLTRRRGVDFIQAVDIAQRRWVKGGLEHERYQYYFPLNFKAHRRWFDRLTRLQQLLRIRRQPPDGLRMHLGSQWFCLSRETATRVSARLQEPSIRRFFALCWIPDECAIQTLVVDVQKPERIARHTLTYHEFDRQGLPVVLDNGHLPHLLNQPFFFARKLSPHATTLMAQIDAHLRTQELDLSYFEHVGAPTHDHARHQLRALSLPSARSRVGSSTDTWRGPMGGNTRRYYVVHGTSRRFALELMQRVRAANPRLPAFDFMFDPQRLVPAAEAPAWGGFQSGMLARRDYDPPSFLYELVNQHPELPAAFCLDAAIEHTIRDVVLWDGNATVVDCEPRGLGKYQRAEAALRSLRLHDQDALFEATLRAVPVAEWLPQDFFDKASREGKHSCRFLRLSDVDEARTDDPVLRAMRVAWVSLQGGDHFAPSEEAAWNRIYGAAPARSGP